MMRMADSIRDTNTACARSPFRPCHAGFQANHTPIRPRLNGHDGMNSIRHGRAIRVLSGMVFFYGRNDRSRSEFVTTLMLLKAMAPAARMGLSCRRKSGAQSNGARTPAAMGMSTTL